MEIEFKVGDPVTYKPYEKALPARVKAVDIGGPFKDKADDRVFYHLTGTSKKRSEGVCAKTTGKSIIESKYFEGAD